MNFADITEKYAQFDTAKIVILPVLYDGTSTWQKGSDKGPEAILEASANMELYDIETDCEVFKQGIFTAEPIAENTLPELMVHEVEKSVSDFLKADKFVVTLGGEHSVSMGTIKAHSLKYENLTILQLDAHTDLREDYEGSRFNHACVMARVKEMELPFLQVGIRSMDIEEKTSINPDRTFFAKDIAGRSDWQEQVIPLLSENVYVTIDLDVFDPALMPSTGTPEPGGLDWWNVLKLLKLVAENCNIIGFDVVELCPSETNKAPDFLAAKLIYKLLSYKFGNENR
ncbi:MAG: agmatinase [Candidatus Cloacimonetes bacterium]|nr:agmatinase [Candidatus Cloacimonadota bacterium]MCF7815236.1 agmatinase [Candidatus Cloacimonadota bacterium]MCF7867315.1 agmatinase [Candidatus Cloacimonadota bacterium]MCF7884705.1 agmatinase [Candidatus Cloacimonadota bacterium]